MFKRLILVVVVNFIALQSVFAIEVGKQFVSIAFHDIVDTSAELSADAVTTDRLIGFFEFLKGNDWTVLSLDDVIQASQGKKQLPKKSVLITFDDGYQSLYTRVYPLAVAYGFPVVSALVGEWVDAPMDATVQYGNQKVPRKNFVSWDNVREMKASGFVEFISHSYAMHRDVLGNPQGGRMPAATTSIYHPSNKSYESADEYKKRLQSDFVRQNKLFIKQLGQAPRAVAWPFGRYTQEVVQVASQHGYKLALTLDDEPSDASVPMAISRYIPMGNPTLGENVSYLRYTNGLPSIQRIVSLDISSLWSPDSQESEVKLGRAIERIRDLGATAVMLDAVTLSADGKKVEKSWFKTATLELQGDFLSRVAWQMRTRAGALPYVKVPLKPLMQTFESSTQQDQWFSDLGRMVPIDGLVFEDVSELSGFSIDQGRIDGPWDTRSVRRKLRPDLLHGSDSIAFKGFQKTAFYRPLLKLVTINSFNSVSPKLGDAVDLSLYSSTLATTEVQMHIDQLIQSGLLSQTATRRRFGLWFESSAPPNQTLLVQATRHFEIAGGTVIGWSPDDGMKNLPKFELIAPTVSASNFPIKF